jgi:tetratricopeptide (TPR) repeat protein
MELMLRAANAEREARNLESSQRMFRDAADMAKRYGYDDLFIRAALGAGHMGAGAGPGIVDHDLIALIEDALAIIGDAETTERAILMGRLGVDLYWSQRRPEAIELARQAVELARRLGDSNTLLTTLAYRDWMLWGPENLEQRLAVSSEIIRLAEKTNRMVLLRAREARLSAMLEIGEIHEVDAEIAAIENIARHDEECAGYVERFKAMRSLMRGEFDEAERWIMLASEIAHRRNDQNFLLGCTGQYGQLLSERGHAEKLLPSLAGVTAEISELPVVRMAVAYVYAMSGRIVQARTEFEYLAVDNFSKIPDDWNWLGTIGHLAVISTRIGDIERASILRGLMEPYAGRSVTLGWGEVYYNAVSFYLGVLSSELCEFDRAQREFEAALRFNRRMGAGPALARTQTEYARMLLKSRNSGKLANTLLADARKAAQEFGMCSLLEEIEQITKLDGGNHEGGEINSSPAGQEAVFARDGDLWKAEWLGQAIHLRPMKGFEAVRYLLSRPGDAVPIVELGQIIDLAVRGEVPLDSADRGDAGPMLDAEAKQEYRARLRELHSELDEAREFNDLGRIEELSRELEYLEGELRRAVGLGGRDRRVSSASERARIRVTNAIRGALTRIERYSPDLGAHLRASIKTGAICSYRPDPGVAIAWRLDPAPIDPQSPPKT